MDANLYCEMCGISSTGPIPYEAHLKSKIHKKHVMANFVLPCLGVTPSLRKRKNKETAATCAGYVCDICGVSMSGLLNYHQHLQGNTHKKMLARASTSEKKITTSTDFNSDAAKKIYLKDVITIGPTEAINEALKDFFNDGK